MEVCLPSQKPIVALVCVPDNSIAVRPDVGHNIESRPDNCLSCDVCVGSFGSLFCSFHCMDITWRGSSVISLQCRFLKAKKERNIVHQIICVKT